MTHVVPKVVPFGPFRPEMALSGRLGPIGPRRAIPSKHPSSYRDFIQKFVACNGLYVVKCYILYAPASLIHTSVTSVGERTHVEGAYHANGTDGVL